MDAKALRRRWFVSLRIKLLVGFTLLFSAAFSAAYYWFYTYATASALQRVQEELVNTLHGAAAGVDGDELGALYTEDVPLRADGYTDDPRYWRQVAWLDRVHQIEPRAEPYTYIKGEQPKELIFITSAGAMRDPPFGAKFLEHYIANNPAPNYQGLVTTTLEPAYTDKFGYWISGYTPIYDSQGNVVAAIGVDFQADYVDQVQAGIRRSVILAFAATYVTLILLVYLVSRAFTAPIIRLTRAAQHISEGAYEQGVNELAANRALDPVPDEIEGLAAVFQNMVDRVSDLLATQMEIAARNERLYQAERRAREVAETLGKANLALTQNLDLDAALNALLDYLEQLVPYDSANVMLLDPADPSRVMDHVLRGYEKWVSPSEKIRPLTLDIQAVGGLRLLFKRGASVVIPDTRAFPDWADLDDSRHVRSWLGVPLIVRGQIIGLYSLDKSTPNFFTEEHQRLVELLSAPAAIAIENARLFEEAHAGRERLRQLAHQTLRVQEDERRRVSRELHDEAGQALVALKIALESVLGELPPDMGAFGQRLQKGVDLVAVTTNRIRWLAHDLRPPVLETVGLHATLDDYCLEYAERTRLQIDYAGADMPGLSSEANICLYRFVQEALTNVVKHAQATRVWIELRGDDSVAMLSVADNGQGFDARKGEPDAASIRGIGLAGLTERLELLGGWLAIESTPGQGTRLTAYLPKE